MINRILIFISVILTSCSTGTYKVDDFDNEDLKWFKPFKKEDTVIFMSEKNEFDTIIFQKVVADSDSTRGFSQGYSNSNYLTVPYEFTKGSYHQFAMMSGGTKRYPQDILNLMKSSSDYGSLEIIFLGTIFGDSLKNIDKINDTLYYFDSDKADYSGMNVEKGINSFTFNTNLGVTEYIDERNIKWKRKNTNAKTVYRK